MKAPIAELRMGLPFKEPIELLQDTDPAGSVLEGGAFLGFFLLRLLGSQGILSVLNPRRLGRLIHT